MGYIPRGGDLTSTISVCVCRKVKIWISFRFQVNGMNAKMSFKKGGKFAVSLYMGMIFEIYCMKLEAKVPRVNYKLM